MYIGNVNLQQLLDANLSKDFISADDLVFQEMDAPTPQIHHPHTLEKQLKEALILGDLSAIEDIGATFATYPSSILCRDNPIRSLKNNLICSCALVTRTMIEVGVEEGYAYRLSDLYINKIESLSTEAALLRINVVMLMDFLSQIQNSHRMKQGATSLLVKNALGCIHNHLFEALSLDLVARAVNANPSYLSRRFKQEMGIGLTDYIHGRRTEKAKQLLTFTDLSIVDIALKVGYGSQSHFSKVFKKNHGVSPLEFRKEQQ